MVGAGVAQDLEDLQRAVQVCNTAITCFDTSCFNGACLPGHRRTASTRS